MTKNLPTPETASEPTTPKNLILWNDDNEMSHVVRCLHNIIGHPAEKAIELMVYVHHHGKGVVYTGSFEVCEHYQLLMKKNKLTTTIE